MRKLRKNKVGRREKERRRRRRGRREKEKKVIAENTVIRDGGKMKVRKMMVRFRKSMFFAS